MAETGSFTSDLRALLESGEGSDVTLVVGESELRAHSFILAARSPVFAAMLRSDMLEASSRRIQITDTQEATLRQLLSFAYTDSVPQLDSFAAELLPLADKYDLPLLKRKCEQQLERGIGVDNAATTAALAVLHRCPGLKAAAVKFIAGHPEVLATEGWQRVLLTTAAAAVEVCRQLATTPPSQPPPPKVATKKTATDPQPPETSESRAVAKEKRQKLAAKLVQAATSGFVRELWALLAAGAPKEARDGSGNTALHLAAANGHASSVKCLLASGLDVNAVNSSRQTPLHVATQKGDPDIMWALVAAGACLDAQDNQGQTPLHVAAQKERRSNSFNQYDSYSYSQDSLTRVVNVLLLAGARKDIRNQSGKTPENVASSSTKSVFSTYNDM